MSSGLKTRTNQAEGERKKGGQRASRREAGRKGRGGDPDGGGAGALAVLQKPLSVTSLVLFKHM